MRMMKVATAEITFKVNYLDVINNMIEEGDFETIEDIKEYLIEMIQDDIQDRDDFSDMIKVVVR